MVFVEDVAVMSMELLIIKTEPVGGITVTFDDAT